MPSTFEALQAEVLRLPPADRAKLLDRLIASLDVDAEAAWDAVADRRENELESGSSQAVPVEVAIARLEARSVNWKLFIMADPEIMHGAVCFRGTRVPVSVVLGNLAAGETAAAILEAHPTLKPEHVPAAISYAADLARERIVAVPA